MCENIDQNVGRILQQLDKQKQRENTVVLFLTDNGPNGNRYNGDMRGIKGSEHEGGCRVPCFLRYPARWPTGRNIPTVSAHIDVLPTLCELCSIPTTDPKQLDGRSLVPLLMGETLPDRTLFFRHSVPTTARPGGAVRTERYRMVRPAKQWQLFDMIQDPGESHDLSKQKPEIVQNLTRQYDAWLKSVMHELGEKPILEIGHPQENPVELSTANSTYTGGPKFYGKHANNNWLVDWSAPTAQANWTVQNKTPGRYKVRLRYLLDAKNPATATVTIASATTSGTLPPATPQQVPSPDRVPRDEVPEMIWATADLGTITIPSGQQMIRLEAQRELAQKLHIQRLIFEAE
jgi:arylsulfatase A